MIPWGGLSCCIGAAALCLLWRNSGRDAQVLRSVTRVDQLKDFFHISPSIAVNFFVCIVLYITVLRLYLPSDRG